MALGWPACSSHLSVWLPGGEKTDPRQAACPAEPHGGHQRLPPRTPSGGWMPQWPRPLCIWWFVLEGPGQRHLEGH